MSDGGAVRRMLLTNIGELVTNDPAPDRDGGPLGIVRDAAVLVEGTDTVGGGAPSEAIPLAGYDLCVMRKRR